MGIFNFLETFFILSLAIMFVLVGLLIYHIRDRLNASEQRIDNLFDIATNLTNEINSMKIHQANSRYTTVYAGKNGGGGGVSQPFHVNPDSMAMPTLMQLISRSNDSSNKIIVSDDETDSESDSDSEYESDSESDSDSESNHEESNISHTISIVDSGAVEEIHVIKKDMEPSSVAAAEESDSDSDSSIDIDEDVEEVEDESKQSLAKEPKTNAEINTNSGINIHKMSIGELKKLALEKNIISPDAPKMKKQELLNLLKDVVM